MADYVPETIDVNIGSSNDLYFNDPLLIDVKSDFLYGSPASGLEVESSVTVRQKRRLFTDYQDYVFGSSDEFAADFSRLEKVVTDNQGLAKIEVPNGLLRSE